MGNIWHRLLNNYILYILSVCLLFARSSVSNNYDLVKKHMGKVGKFECRLPQARLVAVRDVWDNISLSVDITPDVTIIHRCDKSTGYCGSKSTCAAESQEEVSLPFLMTPQFIGKGKSYYMNLTFVNHTLCKCLLPLDIT